MSIFRFKEFNESIKDLRAYLDQDPDFSEKGKELDSGGKLDDSLSNIFISILSEIAEKLPNLKVTATSGNDRFHKNLSGTSKHKLGKALDFVISPYSNQNAQVVKGILDQFAAGNKGFSYLDEYTKPSSRSTGGHFHISYDPINPEASHSQKSSYIKPISLGQDSSGGIGLFDFGFGKLKPRQTSGYLDTWASFFDNAIRNR